MIINGATVISGGKKGGIPNVNAGRWDDECWLNLNYQDMLAPDVVPVAGKMALQKGWERFETWQLNDEVLEAAVVFASVPAKKAIRLRMSHSAGLSLYPQPMVMDADSYAPDRVLGSLAVYHNKAHNKYQVGKLCHLYRWECIDANGVKAWCDPLAVDGEFILIGLPVDFLKKAAYPVIAMGAGDTFGYTSAGASQKSFTSSADVIGSLHATLSATSETISSYHVYTSYGSGASGSAFDVTVYSGAVQQSTMNGATRAFAGTTITPGTSAPAKAWETASVSHSLGALEYALAVGTLSGGAQVNFYYDATSGVRSSEHDANALPATWTQLLTNTRQYSIYATYSAGAGFNPGWAKATHMIGF